jgi:hypothetical protein
MQFDEWLDEIEGNKFVMRSERMFEDMEIGDYRAWLKWLRAAYDVGYEAGKEDGKEIAKSIIQL